MMYEVTELSILALLFLTTPLTLSLFLAVKWLLGRSSVASNNMDEKARPVAPLKAVLDQQ